jgi:hypothetical protein
MSSGLHGTNAIDPTTSYNIYKRYVLPRLLYRLVKHQEVGRLKEWQLVLVTTEIVLMYLYEIYPVFLYTYFYLKR